MTFDTTTFVLQILNFLVLLWFLHRFVYAPLRAAVAKRQADMAAAQTEFQERCAALEADKAALKQQREESDAARRTAETTLAEAIAVERMARLSALEKELAAVREQGLARIDLQLAARMAASDQQLQQRIDATLRAHLQNLACPALESILLDRFIADIEQLDSDTRTALKQLDWTDSVVIDTAFPVSEAQKNRLLATLSALRGEPVAARWRTVDELMAGVRVGLDGKEIELSLAHSLQVLPASILLSFTALPTLAAPAT